MILLWYLSSPSQENGMPLLSSSIQLSLSGVFHSFPHTGFNLSLRLVIATYFISFFDKWIGFHFHSPYQLDFFLNGSVSYYQQFWWLASGISNETPALLKNNIRSILDPLSNFIRRTLRSNHNVELKATMGINMYFICFYNQLQMPQLDCLLSISRLQSNVANLKTRRVRMREYLK